MVQLNYSIDDDLHRRAKVAAVEQGVTLKDFVIEALERAVENHEKGSRGNRRGGKPRRS